MNDDAMVRACTLGARTALTCSELVTLVLELLPHVSDPDIAREAFDRVRDINKGLTLAVEAFDSKEKTQ